MNLENVPAAIKSLDQWVCWKYETRGGKPTKIPITIGGDWARSTDPVDWYSFGDCVEAAEKRGFAGVGFVFTADDPFIGIDLDDCFTDDGRLKPWAIEIVRSLEGTYSEVSPSGKGLKVFATGENPLKSGRKVAIDDGAIEVYSQGRFFTVTGDAFDESETTDKTAELTKIAELFPKEPEPKPFVAPSHVDESAKVERARRYLEHLEPSISGQQGHDKAFRAACCLVIDFDLDTETALSILASDFNPRCSPAWSEKELRHKVDQANKQTGPRGSKLADPIEALATEQKPFDLGSMIGAAVGVVSYEASDDDDETEPIAETPENNFPECCKRPPGLIEAVMNYTDSQSLYVQPMMSLAGALALMSTITGRKLTDKLGTRTNLYVLSLAPSGSGKDASRKANKKLLKLAGADGRNMIGPERFGSSAGIVSAVAENPAILFQIDEIGKLMSSLKGRSAPAHLTNIASVLMQLYTSSDDLWIGDAYADLTRTKQIEEPHAVIYGSSVAEGFWHNLTKENVTDGLLGRMLPVEVPGRVRLNKRKQTSPPNPAIVSSVKWWVDLKPQSETPVEGVDLSQASPGWAGANLITANHSPEAWDRHIEHLDKISERQLTEDEEHAAIWARTGERTSKLALIFAASRVCLTPFITIELEDVDRAIALSNWVTRTILERVFLFVATNEQEEHTKKAYRVIADARGGSIERSAFTRKTQWLNKRQRNEIVETLVEAGQVIVDTKQTKQGKFKTVLMVT